MRIKREFGEHSDICRFWRMAASWRHFSPLSQVYRWVFRTMRVRD